MMQSNNIFHLCSIFLNTIYEPNFLLSLTYKINEITTEITMLIQIFSKHEKHNQDAYRIALFRSYNVIMCANYFYVSTSDLFHQVLFIST